MWHSQSLSLVCVTITIPRHRSCPRPSHSLPYRASDSLNPLITAQSAEGQRDTTPLTRDAGTWWFTLACAYLGEGPSDGGRPSRLLFIGGGSANGFAGLTRHNRSAIVSPHQWSRLLPPVLIRPTPLSPSPTAPSVAKFCSSPRRRQPHKVTAFEASPRGIESHARQKDRSSSPKPSSPP